MAAMYSASDFFDLNSFEEARKVIKKMLDDGAKAADKLAEAVQKLTEIDKSYTKVLKEKQMAVQSLNADFLSGKQMTLEMQKALNSLSKEMLDTAKNVKQIRTENEKLKGNYETVTKASKELKDSTEELGKQFEGANKKAKELADGSLAQMKQRLKELRSEYESLGKATDEAVKDSVLIKIKNLSDEIRKEEDLLKNATKAAKEQGSAYDQLSAQLNQMRKRYKDMAVSENEASEESKQLLKDIQKLDKQLKDIDASVGQFQRSVGNYQDAFKGLGGGLKDAIGSFSGLGSIMAGGGAFAVGQVAAELLVNTLMQVNESLVELRKNLRETETLTNKTGEEVLSITANVKAMSMVFEQDFSKTLQATQRAMLTFGATSDEAFNIISRGLVQAGSEGDDLLEGLKDYGGQFQRLGFSLEQTVGFLSTGIQKGAYQIDTAGDIINNAKIELQRFDVSGLSSFLNGKDLDETRKIIKEFQSGRTGGVEAIEKLTTKMFDLGIESRASGELVTKIFTAVGEEKVDVAFLKSLTTISQASKDLYENLTESEKALLNKNAAVAKTQHALAELALATTGISHDFAIFGENLKAFGAEFLLGAINQVKDFIDEFMLVTEFAGEVDKSLTDLFGVTELIADGFAYVKESVLGLTGETDGFLDTMFAISKALNPLQQLLFLFKQIQAVTYAWAAGAKVFKDAFIENFTALGNDLKALYQSIKGNIKEFIGYDEFVETFYFLKRVVKQISDDLSTDWNNAMDAIGSAIDKGIAYFDELKEAVFGKSEEISNGLAAITSPITDTINGLFQSVIDAAKGAFDFVLSILPSIEKFLPENTINTYKKAINEFSAAYDSAIKKMTKTDEDRAKERQKNLDLQAAQEKGKNSETNKLTIEQQEGLDKALYELRKQRLANAQTLAKEESADEQKTFEERLAYFKEYENKKKAEIELTRRFEIAQAAKSTKSEGERGLAIQKINEAAAENIRKVTAETTKFEEDEYKKRGEKAKQAADKGIAEFKRYQQSLTEIQKEIDKLNEETSDIRNNMRIEAINNEIAALEKLLDAENLTAEQRKAILMQIKDTKDKLSKEELEITRAKLQKEYDLDRQNLEKQLKNRELEPKEKEKINEQLKALDEKFYAEIDQLNTNFNTKVQENQTVTTEKLKEEADARRKMWVEAIGGGLLSAFEQSQQNRINSIEDENEKFKQQILLKVKMIALEIVLKKIADPKASIEGNLAGGLGSLIGTIGGGLYEGGYTGDKTLFIDKNGREATNFVHKNEYVIPEKMVKDPQISPFVSAIDKVRTTNNKSYLYNAGMQANTQIVEVTKQAPPIIDENKLAAKIGAEVAKNIPQTNIMETARTITVSQKQKGMENTIIFDKIRAKMGSGF